MKKTKKTTTATEEKGPKIYKWRKLGKGTLSLGGKTYREGDVFTAREIDIPRTFRDLIVKVDEDSESVKTKATPQMIRRTGGTYDVYNNRARKVNESPLSRADAVELLATL